jgi:hypothetical protein
MVAVGMRSWQPFATAKEEMGGETELIQADGIFASAINRQQGGRIVTPMMEALDLSTVEARRSLTTKWSRPRWLGDGHWQMFHAGREPTSCLLLFLGSDAWRTPVSSGRDTLSLIALVQLDVGYFFTICEPLSSNTRFVRTSVARGLLQNVYTPLLMKRVSWVF